MLDLNELPQALLLARGQYATVRSAHEDSKKQLQMLCGKMGATAAQILRAMQPDNDGVPASVAELMATCRTTLDMIDSTAMLIESLAQQRAELKPLAWPKR